MIKLFDFKCEKCNKEFEIYSEDIQNEKCPECNGKLTRIFSSMNFKLIYNNKTDMCGWADNNYDASQYYRQVNEARARGENVTVPD